VIALSSATSGGGAAGLPTGLPAGAGPAAAPLPAAFLAFDDVFRQLTGGLLTTSAEAGAAAPPTDAEPGAGAGDVTEGVEMAAAGIVAAPVVLALPAVAAAAVPADGTGAGLDAVTADEAGASTTAPPTSAERTPGAAAQARRGEPGAAPPAVRASAAPVARATPAGSVPAEATAASTAHVAESGPPMTVPAGPTQRDLTPDTTSVAGSTPAIEVGAHAQGLDRRRGMRETPAPARTFNGATAASEPEARGTAESAPTTPSPSAPSPVVPDGEPATPREDTAHAERMFALQRALARQTASDHRETPAPGLAAQVLRAPGGHAGQGADAGAEAGADGQAPGRRQGRAWGSPLQTGAPLAVAGAGAAMVNEVASMATQAVTLPGPAAGAAWRAAMASTAVVETLSAANPLAAMPAAPAHLASVLAAPAEWPMLRDRAPMVVDVPMPSADLDAATAESVHTQIVRSIRMQWTGGLAEARVTLRPEYLGEVVATIKVDQGVVTATLQADTPEVRRWMESHTATLRDALVEQGLKLDRLTIAEPEREPAEHQRQGRPRPRQQDARRPPTPREAATPDTPFEVVTE